MSNMNVIWRAAVLGGLSLCFLGAVARADDPAAVGDGGRKLMVMAPGCAFDFHPGRTRAGDNLPARMTLRNTGQWCFGALGWSGFSIAATRISSTPDHGELKLKVEPPNIMFVYRPVPGFTGTDRFIIEIPTGAGNDVNLAATVTVEP